ncbi:(Fe-S)-binding protein [Desulfobacula sp.]|uniref:(Fe-S)-binding protein n=1 Tax=Desulfobacula sp. TaxID=2593537 RepID=UPI0025BCB0EA|nr:(Fe-S)-binding protein [Desulfobacula sp.]MBC2703733.1 (Fe-S)-binding protein [Desulfobacula sp.]
MNPLFMSLLLIVGLAIFGRTMVQKIQLLMALEPTDRVNHIMDRIKNVVIIALAQKRLVGRKKEWAAGIMHAFIFWGFCILLIRSLNLYGEGFVKGFQLPLFGDGSILGYLYIALKDVMEGIVLLMAVYAIFRRAVLKPTRLHNTWEAYFVLGMIGVLMISDLLLDGARYNLIMLHNNPDHLHFFNNPQYGSEFLWTPVSVGAASLISGFSADANRLILTTMFWLHIITQLTFLNFLPLGKHFHVITALPNVFLKNLGYPHEKTKLLDLEDESVWEDESLGINHIHQLNWKQGLDLYTCTECGRCKEVCPTYTTDKPLNLHDFNDTLKAELFDNADNLIKRAKLAATIKEDGDPEQNEEIKAQMAELNSKKPLIGDVISEDTLWACTTCRACEQVCPVTIEHVPRIMAMRQGQSLMAGVYPQELNVALKGLERNGNPWGIGYDKRAEWADGLDVKTMADDADVDYLLWVGCAGSFDDRSKKVSKSLVKILQKANISFAILGKEEKCTGDFARRVGNEMMYQMMAQENIETLNNYKVKKIIAACPHCLNALKHEYPQMGGNYEVIHHTDFIDQLIKSGKITLTKSLEGALTYHDPCYLGRYNSIYDQPRSILEAISKDGLKELDRHGQESFCCGAGGGRMWMEETIGKRINVERSEEIAGQEVATVAVACPFCLTMIEDGMKELDKDEDIKTQDIAELVANNMA